MAVEGDRVLFNDRDLWTALKNQESELIREVHDIPDNEFLNSSAEGLVDYLVQKFRVNVPRLRPEGIRTDLKDAWVGQPDWKSRGTVVKYFVPFEGEADLFLYQASTFSTDPPWGQVDRAGELRLTYETRDHNAAGLKAQFENDLGRVKKYLQWIENDVGPFNDRLPHRARELVQQRRDKLLKDKGLAADLGYPLRERPGSTTYPAPEVRRKPPIKRPPASTEPYRPEPVLEEKEYDHILGVLRSMVKVMERSPTAFADMGEEDLRQQFLVQLNGHYQGQATGETFNFEGKTDILIRADDKNIFIAECKFWKGPASLTKTVDQLLGYVSWRDTKTAILLFNRRGKFSAVVEKIPDVVHAHPNFKREGPPTAEETEWRFVLGHRDDANRELILTVMAFDVPSPAAA